MTKGKATRRAGSWVTLHVGARKWPDNAYNFPGELPAVAVKPWVIVQKIAFHINYYD